MKSNLRAADIKIKYLLPAGCPPSPIIRIHGRVIQGEKRSRLGEEGAGKGMQTRRFVLSDPGLLATESVRLQKHHVDSLSESSIYVCDEGYVKIYSMSGERTETMGVQ